MATITSNDVLKALERNETVSVLYRGKVKGVILPVARASSSKLRDHAFFGSLGSAESVERTVDRLREEAEALRLNLREQETGLERTTRQQEDVVTALDRTNR